MIFLFQRNLFRILTLFSLSPGSGFNRKKIQEKTLLNNVGLNESLNYLVNLKILKREKSLYSLNFENSQIDFLLDVCKKEYIRLKQLPLKEYFMILEIVSEFYRVKNINKIFLFGSYSKLLFTEKSDIDFAIISDKVEEKEISRLVSKLESRFNKKIEVHFFDSSFYKNRKDPLVKEILSSGVAFIN